MGHVGKGSKKALKKKDEYYTLNKSKDGTWTVRNIRSGGLA